MLIYALDKLERNDMSAITAQLTRLFDEFTSECQQQGNPTILVEDDWLSPALLPGFEVDHECEWLPASIENTPLDMFERLSDALEIDIPQSIIDYYTCFWSQPILANHTEGELPNFCLEPRRSRTLKREPNWPRTEQKKNETNY